MMTRTAIAMAILALLGLVGLGCGESSQPTAPADSRELIASDILNGPSDLPNVLRFEENFFLLQAFPAEDKGLAIGFPEDLADFLACGGTETAGQLVAVQHAGQFKEILKRLAMARDVNVHVWNLSDFLAAAPPRICNAPLLAQGMGDLRNTDNDFFFEPEDPNANSFGWSVIGLVEDAAGVTHRLTASVRFLIFPDDTFKIVQAHINLHPMGK